ncbi:MAG: hypothetical protein KJ977_04410 [Candidatus Omnitrophica bacterium]|nr:hypothetical protein [Candidatus Omnitrophota bacterium]MBU2266264.1 hypothetical protein [Candidatus Omnitrophota bacterium]MBU2473624.1 hypothetical protein [Candidatus Omnitrophota bacterium]
MQQAKDLFNYFHSLKKHSSIGSSYIFVGEYFSSVFEIVKLINCQAKEGFCGSCWDCQAVDRKSHPDLFTIEPEGLTIKIETVREVIRFLSLKSFRLGRKSVVIQQAQNLTLQAQNAFLKTLEEPPKNSFIALCTSKLEGLLPTINSRCRKIFLPFQEESLDLSLFKPVTAFLSGQDISFKDRKEFSSFVWNLIRFLHQGLLAKASGQNNQLSNLQGCAIILKNHTGSEIQSILEELLKIYAAGSSININLALNLIRMNFQGGFNR